MAVTPRLDHREAFERGGRARQHHRQSLEMSAHHRDVARVIMDAILLLEARLMRLVDDDDAEPGIGQEQRRARPAEDIRFARADEVIAHGGGVWDTWVRRSVA